MKSCERCGTHFGPWLRVYDGNGDALTMRRQCRCRWWFDAIRVSGLKVGAVDVLPGVVESEISNANKRALANGWAPSWGWAVAE